MQTKFHTCFLLGAGFTHAITGKESLLCDQLMSRISDLIIPELKDDFEDTFPNIELFITLLDLRIASLRNEKIRQKTIEVKDKIREKIVSLYDIGALNKRYPLCEEFIKKISKNDCILTLNYDCVLDKYLWLSGRWSPNNGYALSLFPGTQIKDNKKLNNILLLKMHGSVNFRDRGIGYGYPCIEVNNAIYPNISANHNNRRSRLDQNAHVLLMSYVKFPPNGLRKIWSKALDKLKEVSRLVIIGCSLRDEDEYLKFALYHFGVNKRIKEFKIEIIDKNIKAAMAIKSKIEVLVGNPRLQKYKIHKNFSCFLKTNKRRSYG